MRSPARRLRRRTMTDGPSAERRKWSACRSAARAPVSSCSGQKSESTCVPTHEALRVPGREVDEQRQPFGLDEHGGTSLRIGPDEIDRAERSQQEGSRRPAQTRRAVPGPPLHALGDGQITGISHSSAPQPGHERSGSPVRKDAADRVTMRRAGSPRQSPRSNLMSSCSAFKHRSRSFPPWSSAWGSQAAATLRAGSVTPPLAPVHRQCGRGEVLGGGGERSVERSAPRPHRRKTRV